MIIAEWLKKVNNKFKNIFTFIICAKVYHGFEGLSILNFKLLKYFLNR